MPSPNTITVERVTHDRYKVGYYRFNPSINDNEHIGFDGTCAQTVIFLTRLLFEQDAKEDVQDQRDESDAIGEMVLNDMRENPEKFISKKDK